MSRWLAQLRADEKNEETASRRTDKTDETPAFEVLSVLSVRQGGENEIFEAPDMPTDEDAEVAFAERAAILEYDEGLPRAEAERLARAFRSMPAGDGGSAKFASPLSQDDGAIPEHPSPSLGVGSAASAMNFGQHHVRASDPAPPHYLTLRPVAGPGVTITAPAVEVSAQEYDRHADALIAAAGGGTIEANVIAFKRSKGAVLPRGQEGIFTRGRT